jgi:DNA ligase 1
MFRVINRSPTPIETPFNLLAEISRNLEATNSRNEKTEILARFLKRLRTDEIPHAVRLILGRVFSENDPRTIDVGWSTTRNAIRNPGQQSLFETPLTISLAYEYFSKLAEARGKNSRRKKETLLERLLSQTSSVDREFLLHVLSGEMRHGVVEGVMLDAISKASQIEPRQVRRANMLLGDIGDLAKLALTKGAAGLRNVHLQLFRPIKPMLAEMSYDIEEVLREHGGTSAFEYKLDGARIQIHRLGNTVKIYSRRLSEVTESLPDIVELAKTQIPALAFLVEGEVVAVSRNGKPLPFQELMRRFSRVHDIATIQKEIPLRLYLFDILFLEGQEFIDIPYSERWKTLANHAPSDLLAPRIITSERGDVERFLQDSLKAGHEGLMAKALASDYTPGHRGKKWFKIKPAETLDLVIIAAEWGSGRRRGWLSNYHLGARNPDKGGFDMLGKTFKGLTDEEFKQITKRLLALKLSENQWVVNVHPRIVVEVAFNEIQRSPHYESGFALRFARIARFRDDKDPESSDSIQKVRDLYQRQFEAKGRLEW